MMKYFSLITKLKLLIFLVNSHCQEAEVHLFSREDTALN